MSQESKNCEYEEPNVPSRMCVEVPSHCCELQFHALAVGRPEPPLPVEGRSVSAGATRGCPRALAGRRQFLQELLRRGQHDAATGFCAAPDSV